MTFFNLSNRRLVVAAALLVSVTVRAAAPVAVAATDETAPSLFSNTLFNSLLAFIVVLLIVIIGFSQLLQGSARYTISQTKKKKDDNPPSGGIVAGLLLLAGLLLPVLGFGQAQATDAAATVRETPNFPDSIGGLSIGVFSLMVTVIFFELLTLYLLWNSAMRLLNVHEKETATKAKKKKTPAILEKFNASVAIEEEAAILLDHEYDGIRELDNNLPPWWKYGFYFTIVFAFAYVIHYHVIKTGNSQEQEYNAQVIDLERQKAEFRKTAANLVDETSVTLLTAADSLAAGKSIFSKNCVACHGQLGEGGIGPNLTDNYWIHGAEIKNLFTVIKYGVQGKSMKAWEELSPLEMQEVASFILSLKGTNPPNGKAPEGILAGAKTDSTTVPTTDSLKAATDTAKVVSPAKAVK